jgi:hypothetical protein
MPSNPGRVALACLAVAYGLGLAPSPDAAAEPPPAKDWELEIAPYGWLALLHGQVDTPRGKREFTIDAHEVLESLDLGAMGSVKFRWRRWVALVDVAWAKLSDDGGLGDSRVRYDVKQKLGWFEALGGYRVYEKPGGLFGAPTAVEKRTFGVDALGGLSYSWSDLRLKLSRDPLLEVPQQNRKLEPESSWVAPYLGFRFHNDFTERLRLQTLLGVGAFGVGDAPHVSWQVTSEFSYAITERFLINAGYKALGFRDSDLKLTFHGPLVGVGFRF